MKQQQKINETQAREDGAFLRPIAVIGAGLAGLSAAQVLSSHGISVKVFDRGRFVGGRLGCFGGPEARQALEKGPEEFGAWDAQFVQACEQWVKQGLLKRSNAEKKYRFASTSRSFMQSLITEFEVKSSSEIHSLAATEAGYKFLVQSTDPGRADEVPQRSENFSALLFAAPPLQAERLLKTSPSFEFTDRFRPLLAATGYAPRWVLRVSWLEAGEPRELRIPASTALSEQWLPISRTEVAQKARSILLQQPAEHELSPFYALLPTDLQTIGVQAHRWSIATPTSLLPGAYFKVESESLYFCGDYFQSNFCERAPALSERDASRGRVAISADSGISKGLERAWLSGFLAAKSLLQVLKA